MFVFVDILDLERKVVAWKGSLRGLRMLARGLRLLLTTIPPRCRKVRATMAIQFNPISRAVFIQCRCASKFHIRTWTLGLQNKIVNKGCLWEESKCFGEEYCYQVISAQLGLEVQCPSHVKDIVLCLICIIIMLPWFLFWFGLISIIKSMKFLAMRMMITPRVIVMIILVVFDDEGGGCL